MDYPRNGTVQFEVRPPHATALSVLVRIPQWSRETKVAVNGVPAGQVTAGNYLKLDRTWNPGDQIVLQFDLRLRVLRGDQHVQFNTSLLRGPILLTFDQKHNTMDPADMPELDLDSLPLDYAATLPEVDVDRVAVCGRSTGAHLAMNGLALDDRVKAGVAGCILSTWNHYHRRFRIPPHCDCGISFQLGPHLEQCDWAALAAPKPVQFQHGRQDAAFCPGADETSLDLQWSIGVMPRTEYDMMFAEVKRAYGLAGNADATETWIHDGPHKVDNEAAFQWLNR